MTVSDLTRKLLYNGDGVSKNFVVSFQFFELSVYVEGILMSNGVDYTITQSAPGETGTVVFVTAPVAGIKNVAVVGNTSFTQPTDYSDNDEFPADTFEKSLDREMMAARENYDRIGQTLRAPFFEPTVAPISFSNNPETYLYVDSDGVPLLASVTEPGNPIGDVVSLAQEAANTATAQAQSAEASAEAAQDARDATNNLYTDFDKKYLGEHATPPTLDNQGDSLVIGALYFDTTLGAMRVYGEDGWRAFSAVDDGSVVPSSLDSSKAAEFRAVIKGDTFINVKDHFGVKGGNDAGDWAKIQAALDAEPKGDILFFPADSYVGTVPLVMSKHKSLKLDPNAVLTLSSAVSSDDLLRIAITNPASSDVRNMIIEGGTWIADARANCAINVNPDNSTPGQNPHFETHIRNAMITGGLCGIRIGGATPAGDSNFNTIEGNNIAIQRSGGLAVNLDGCADGHRILNNLMFGPGTGVRLNLVLGAYKTLISGNCIVTRDGALLVTNGSNWSFENNQVEQHGGTNLLGQHIQVQGIAYPAKHWRIVGNNFGGGSDVNYSIWLINSIAGLIDENQMQLCAIADVGLIDGGGGALPKYNTIGARNTFRGARSIRSNLTDASRRMILDVSPGTESNKGIWRTASGFTNSNGWTQSNLRRIVDEYGILHWEGALNGGTLTAGTVIWAAQMPAWERPVDTAACVSVATGSGAGALNFGTNGDMAVISAPNAAVYLSGVSYPVKWWDTYDATP